MDRTAVTAAVFTRLQAIMTGASVDVCDLTGPTTPTRPYIILEHPPTVFAAYPPPIGAPLQHWNYSFRVRTVAGDYGDTAAGGELTMVREWAERIADRTRTGLLDSTVAISGTGWVVVDRQPPDSGGIDHDGTTVNIVDDYTFTVAPT
jgi:hypothetical protein